MNPLLLAFVLVAQVPKPIPVVAPKNPGAISYAKDVAEILEAKCVGCHSAALAENKLLLEDVSGMLKGGKRGPAVVPGRADDSLLFKMAAHRVQPVMPPQGKKSLESLTGEELGKLKSWIDAGAKDDSDVTDGSAKPLTLSALPPGVHPISALDLSPDGNHVAVGRANVVSIFDLADGKELARLTGHKDVIQSVRYSPDGTKLLAGGYGEVIVWISSLPPVSQTSAKTSDQTEKSKAEKPKQQQQSVEKSESKADSGKQRPTRVAAPGVPERWSESRRLGSHVFRVLAIDISADGKLVATAGGEPSKSSEIKIWNLADGKLLRSIEGVHSDTVFALKFSPDGKKLLSGSADRFVKLVNVDDGKELKAFEGHTHHVLGLDWKSDGKQFVSAGADGAVKFWDAESGEQLRSTQGISKPFTSVCWPADRPRVFASSSDGMAREITVSNAQIPRTFPTGVTPVDYLYAIDSSADGNKVVSAGADGVIYLWNGTNAQMIRKIESR